ncbi:MAG: cysteine hydrolase [Zoogloeaceae bacterium]|jgi:nicotinamidase-related amidase|nr:cysteine hydrolase [Zoogloeaceae bacterium]
MKIALILIDIQNDYFPGGKNPLHNPEKAAENAKIALKLFREKGLPILHIQHIALQEGAAFFLPGSEGKEIYHDIKPENDEKILTKHYPDSFFQTGLHEILAKTGVKKIVLCGMMSRMCIDATVRSAKNYLYEVLLLSDACATKDLLWENETIIAENVHKTVMASLQGTFAKIIKTNALEDYL